MVLFLAQAHLKFSGDSFFLLLLAAKHGLFMAALMWTLYLALEPYVRSKWPQTIVSWSRMLAGKLRDPLVGRDILYGTMLGLGMGAGSMRAFCSTCARGTAPACRIGRARRKRAAFSMWLGNVFGAIVWVLLFFFVLVFFRALVRNRWIAAALFVALFAHPQFCLPIIRSLIPRCGSSFT